MSKLTEILSRTNTNHLLILAAFVLCAWYVASSLQAWYRLRHVPGPFIASFSYTWLGHKYFTGTIHSAHCDLRKYGSLVRTGPNYIVTDDPEVLRKINAIRSRYVRHWTFKGGKFHPRLDSMLNMTDNRAHDTIKAKAASGYSRVVNLDIETGIDAQVVRMLSLIQRKFLSTGDTTNPVDLAPLSRYFTLDVITRLAYGKEFGHLDDGTDIYGYVSQVDMAFKLVSMTRAVPFLLHVLYWQPILNLIGPKPTDKTGLGKIMAVTRDIIDRRLQPDAEPKSDMMGTFIKSGMTRDELEAEAMVQIIAGSDTTASIIRATLMYLLSTPRAYGRLKKEINNCLNSEAVSSPITMEEASQLPYLQAIIAEGFRIKNPVIYGDFKVVPPEGDTLNGVFLPGGTAIGYNVLALMRNEAIFGRDVDVFRPERFLDAPAAKRREMERAMDVVFGGGRWMCPGKALAWMEVNKLVFELMRFFDFQLMRPEKPWEEKTHLTVSHKDMWVRITQAIW